MVSETARRAGLRTRRWGLPFPRIARPGDELAQYLVEEAVMLRSDLLERLEDEDAAERPAAGDVHPPKYRDAVEEAVRQLAEQTGRPAR